jgi:nitrogen regulatory protein PII
MKRIVCYIRPHRLEVVKGAIAATGVNGLTVADVRGTGNSPKASRNASMEAVLSMPIRSRLEVVVPDERVEEVIQSVLDCAQSGDGDDGKIFVEPMIDAVRIRTMERGDAAV